MIWYIIGGYFAGFLLMCFIFRIMHLCNENMYRGFHSFIPVEIVCIMWPLSLMGLLFLLPFAVFGTVIFIILALLHAAFRVLVGIDE